MQPLGFAAVFVAALLLGLPAIGLHRATDTPVIGIFDPLTCAMSYGGQCTVAQMIQHRKELLALATAG